MTKRSLDPEFKPAEPKSVAQGARVPRSDSPLIGGGDGDVMPQVENLVALADRITSVRARRAEFFSADLFAEPAWDMLLALYQADAEQRRMTVSEIVRASAGPTTTGLRWLNRLEELGMVTRHKNRLDHRVQFIELAPEARAQIQDYLTETWVSLFVKA